MAWPSSADIDTTKLDNDNDSIKDSRAELYKMAGYVNDMITAGPGASAGSTIDDLLTVRDSGDTTKNIQVDPDDTNFVTSGTIICNDGYHLVIATRDTTGDSAGGGIIQSRITLSKDGTYISLQPLTGGQIVFNAGITKHVGITTTARNALTAENGMIIYNSTTNKFQGYAGGTWVDLH